ncbi:toll/interleukin-1 receptor domain-containing protein [Candidatus Leptofilum sp.]|uniref:toll/interleukin-1 receptor domain-containing protein n=1 Tax=Candidatus Leptofilum sp. TaxID=3241576 RepID=UPI003B5A06D5
MWDVFISHASEDKEAIARPLAMALSDAGLKVWFDEFTLSVGDSLRSMIDYGLSNSRFGVVVLSPAFFSKEKVWTKRELAGLLSRDGSQKVLLPVWYNISVEEVRQFSPILADRLAINASSGIPQLAKELLRAMNIPFTGEKDDVTGMWFGSSGRLRLFRVGGLIEGDYDWNGHDWKAHLSGHFEDGKLMFEWWWDLTQERGAGFFNLKKDRLIGAWWLGQEPDGSRVVRSARNQVRHSWGFVRITNDTFPTIKGQ